MLWACESFDMCIIWYNIYTCVEGQKSIIITKGEEKFGECNGNKTKKQKECPSDYL